MNRAFFFDTYAFFEILRGNLAYYKYHEAVVITTIFNLAELNYNLKKEKGKSVSDAITEKYSHFLVDVTLNDLKEAMDLKIGHKDLSIPDAVGYTVAKRLAVKFLTGDEDFKSMPNVEFVK